ncbi:MAG: hypothetical protein RLZ05_166 [Bacteroidota bacterium]|jgi:hypothetical protein
MSQTTSKYVTLGVLLLLLLNTGLVIFLVADRSRSHSNSSHTRPDIAAQMAKELKMSDAQRQQHLTYRENYYKETRPLYDSIRKMRVVLFSAVGNTQQADSLLIECNEKINRLQNDINTLTIAYLQRVRNILEPAQQKDFDQFILRMMQRSRRDSSKGK